MADQPDTRGEIYRNREEAALELALKLSHYRGKNPLVLAIPRGAVPMGSIVAAELGGQLDVVLTRKLSAPGNPEFVVGSVDESGWVYVADYAAAAGATDEYIDRERARQLKIIRQRRAQYTPGRRPLDPKGRIVIVVDDGLATGSTMIAALHGLRAKEPRKLICAVPVAPPDTVRHIAPLADELICPLTPNDFYAVGQFYRDFPQVSDDEVIEILQATEKAG